MATMANAAHAKPAHRDRLLWVVAVIATFALYDIWGSWTEVGDKSGFAHGTGWTLTVIVEVYGGCALWAWLAGAPGPRSRRFAMWSAVTVFALSLIGQSMSHLTERSQVPPSAVVVFVSVLPVIVLALIAFLIHLRIRDRADAAEAAERDCAAASEVEREAAEASGIAALRAELDALRETLETAQADRDDAQRESAEATAKAEVLARKLSAASGARKRATAPRASRAGSRETRVPNDVDARAEALSILDAEPGVSGAELGPRVGMSKRWGQLLKSELATVPPGPDEVSS